MSTILKSAVLYFAVVFSAGFALGTIRTLWVAPAVGARAAELMEAPIMIAVSILAARWIVRRWHLPSRASIRLSMGGMALGLMLIAEFTFVLWLRGLSIRDYLADRDPVSGTVYYLALLIYALMPLALGHN